MNLLDNDAIMQAAESMLENVIYWELNDSDSTATLPEGMDNASSLAAMIVEQHPLEVALVFGRLVGRIENAWGSTAGLIFHHMGYGDDEDTQARLLYLTFMSCSGEGICINDDHSEEFDNAGRILCNVVSDQGKRFDASPMYYDAHESILSVLVDQHLTYDE